MRWSRLWPSKFVAGQGPRRSAAAGTVLAAEIRADDAGLGYSSGAAKAVVRRMAPFGAFPLPTPHRRGASAHEMQLTLSDCRPRRGSCAQRHLPHSSDSSSRNARRVAAVRLGALPQEQAAPADASAWWPSVQASTQGRWGTWCTSWPRRPPPSPAATACWATSWPRCDGPSPQQAPLSDSTTVSHAVSHERQGGRGGKVPLIVHQLVACC